MAEAFFNMMAKGKALAISAGTDPSAKVEPIVAEAMKEVGLDIRSNKPKMLTMAMIEHADKVITMGCGFEGVCPAAFTETEDWQLEDPKDKPIKKVRKIREEIRARVIELLSEIGD